MKRIALLAAIGAGLMALPSSAAAQATCPNGQAVQTGSSPIYACVNVNGFGGEAEIATSASYGWIDGAQNNPGNTSGYAGFTTNPGDPPCTGMSNSPPNYNTGGCFWVRGAPEAVNHTINDPGTPTSVVTDMFICGNTTGPRDNSVRDGCTIP